jgi:hypothetical protein
MIIQNSNKIPEPGWGYSGKEARIKRDGLTG